MGWRVFCFGPSHRSLPLLSLFDLTFAAAVRDQLLHVVLGQAKGHCLCLRGKGEQDWGGGAVGVDLSALPRRVVRAREKGVCEGTRARALVENAPAPWLLVLRKDKRKKKGSERTASGRLEHSSKFVFFLRALPLHRRFFFIFKMVSHDG